MIIITIKVIMIIKKRKEKEIKKLIKMTKEAIILISWHYKTKKMRNNSKTKHVENNNNK